MAALEAARAARAAIPNPPNTPGVESLVASFISKVDACQSSVDRLTSMVEAELAAALADPAKDVTALFTQTTTNNEGIAVRFSTALHSIVTFGGLIANRTDGIAASITSIGRSRDSLNLRLVQIEARYRAQFTALDTMMSSMSRTSQFLSQQLPRL